MTLIKCFECSSPVSSNADFCPKCGNKDFYDQWFKVKSEDLALQKKKKKEDQIRKSELDKAAKEKGYKSHYYMTLELEKKERKEREKIALETKINNQRSQRKSNVIIAVLVIAIVLIRLVYVYVIK
jgi:hypothetical protein